MPRILIFKPGTFTDMSGRDHTFSAEMLRDAAESYDPAVHEAPCTLGHPQHDDPAYGWVRGMHFTEDGVEADLEDLDPAFEGAVNARRYSYRSAAWYAPDHPQNPRPGHLYLRHLGFLGAEVPAVKGLGPVQFAEDEGEGLLVFSEPGDALDAGLWRSLRNWLLARFGKDDAEEALPENMVSATQFWADQPPQDAGDLAFAADGKGAVENDPAQTRSNKAGARFSEPAHSGGEFMADNPDLEARMKALEEREADIAAREKAVAAKAAESRRAEFLAFAESLAGPEKRKLAPGHVPAVVEFMVHLDHEGEMTFAEKKQSPVQAFMAFLEAQPEKIVLGEHAPGEGGDGAPAIPGPPVPSAYEHDPASLEIHRKALAYAESNKVTYIQAVQAVGGAS